MSPRLDEELRGDEPETVDFLATLPGDGPVLEFAIGTAGECGAHSATPYFVAGALGHSQL